MKVLLSLATSSAQIQSTVLYSELCKQQHGLEVLCYVLTSTLLFFLSTYRLVIALVYYGLSLGSSSLHGSPYLNLFISGIVEIPGLLFAYWLSNRFGRRVSLAVNTGGGGVACLLTLVVPASEFIDFVSIYPLYSAVS